ncbi:MAG: glutathione S-transferase [Herminiimonas sp.]|nr:glutathione S-transferase [Herminiimonas sp.]
MYKLYYYPGNANLAPHMLMEEIGAPHVLVLVDRDNNAQNSAAYLKLNPSGRIPTLIDGDLVVSETAAICLHLADRHPESGMAPAIGTGERALFYKWMLYFANTLQAELVIYFYPERLADDDAMAAKVKIHAERRIAGMLDLIEAQLAQNADQNAGPYLLGATYRAVDPYLFMLARWTRMMDRPASSRAHFADYLRLIADRPAVKRAFTAEGISAPLY